MANTQDGDKSTLAEVSALAKRTFGAVGLNRCELSAGAFAKLPELCAAAEALDLGCGSAAGVRLTPEGEDLHRSGKG